MRVIIAKMKKFISVASGEEENVSSFEQQNDSSVSLELGKIAAIERFQFHQREERVDVCFSTSRN